MAVPNWKLYPLKCNLAGHWAVTVNGNWRITFEFENGDAYILDLEDYH
ncbi:MAG: type II toxin-antitoxin system RelE/ParE family toxin [Gallionella sp.]